MRLLPDLPSQFGASYLIAPGVTARTRFPFSGRMNYARRGWLATAFQNATDALHYARHQADLNYGAILSNQAAPRLALGFATTFLFYFESRFNIDLDVVANPLGYMEFYLGRLDDFRRKCAAISAGLQQRPLEFVDISSMYQGGDTKGYVNTYGEDATEIRHGRIHLDFDRLQVDTINSVAHTIVHEASHKFARTKDLAYVRDARNMRDLTPGRALTNADSIAQMVMGAFEHHLV